MKVAFWILLPILLIGAIFGWIFHSAQNSMKISEGAYDAVQIGDPIEVIDGLIVGDRVDRTPGVETGTWADLVDKAEGRGVGGDVLFRQKGFSGAVIWQFIFDQDRRVSDKFRIVD